MFIPSNLREHYEILAHEGVNLHELFHNFSLPLKERMLRTYVAPVLRYMPTALRYAITDVAKRLRNPSRKPQVTYPLDFKENQLIAEGLKNRDVKPWWNKKAVLCLSHDVDNDEGYEFVSKMAEMNQSTGLSGTFNFLTHDNYRIDPGLLLKLHEMSFEIGLHGYTHDQGFSYRSYSSMMKKVRLALEVLKDVPVTGTRSPALSKSERFFQVMSQSGFQYDSTLQVGSAIYGSVRIPYPYYFEEYDLWELPLMIQDDNYLRDARVSEDFILESLSRYIEETISINGLMVLNMHPHLMCTREKLYQKVLDHITTYSDDLAFKTTGEVNTLLRKNQS